MPQFDRRSDYAKSGLHRLRDAEELMQTPTFLPNESGAKTRHFRGAMYLAGYGVECLLKSYLIRQEAGGVEKTSLGEVRDKISERRIRRGGEAIRDICGVAGHNTAYLLGLTDLEIYLDSLHRGDR